MTEWNTPKASVLRTILPKSNLLMTDDLESGPLTPCPKCDRRVELESTLAETESRLAEVQEGVIRLQDEYRREAEDLKAEVERFSALAEDESDEKVKLERNLTRLRKAKSGLEAYLETLPSKEEFKGLKERLREKEDEVSDLKVKVSVSRVEKDASEDKAERNRRRAERAEAESEEMAEKIAALEERIDGNRRRKLEAETTELEDVLAERDELRAENIKLKRFASIAEKKHNKRMSHISAEFDSVRRSLKQSAAELEAETEKLTREISTNKFLREDLTESKAECGSLNRRIEALNKRLAEITPSAETEKSLARLSREMTLCLGDLSSLSSAASQLSRGEDPNISALLGIQSLQVEEARRDEDERNSVEKIEGQIRQVKMVRSEILCIRDRIAEKYADNLGENFNSSCITS